MLALNEADEFDAVDRAALVLAIELTLQETDQGRVQQVRSMLHDPDRSWDETAHFCSYHQQMNALNLHPWELPPLSIYPDDADYMKIRGRQVTPEAVTLLKRMLDAGISRYHPDPLAALAAVEHCEGGEILSDRFN
jgi:hypothetical protein